MRIGALTLSLTALAALAACNGGGSSGDGEDIEISYVDSDGDTILDIHEGIWVDVETSDGEADSDTVDTDADGLPDHLDTDSDEDGIPDKDEAGDWDPLTLPFDSDGDGVEDFRDLDSDDNCILDAQEGSSDLDGDDLPAFSDLDDDGDGILDSIEIGPDCAQVDSDGDGTADYQDLDSDGDGIGDVFEAGTSAWDTEPADTDGDGTPDYLDLDSDGDGFTDAQEGRTSGPKDEPADTDGDGIYDFADIDSDGDGLTDAEERDVLGTSPYANDTDGDGYSDGAEVAAGTDPKSAASVIEGIYVTVDERGNVEERFDFELNVQMGDIAFLIDTTGSMSGTVNGMTSEFSSIVSQLSGVLPDAEYGVATFDDYNYGGFGSGQDRPFILRQQVTSNISAVQTSLSGIGLHYGNDAPESGMEGLYQGLTGIGYDQNCNGSFDSGTDVRPFLASSSDAFGGSGGQTYTTGSPGGGTDGGYGFRPYALPIIVYATDNNLRDPDAGYATPGGCPGDAGASDVVAAASASGAYLIGIAANYSTPLSQMQDLATRTGSMADTDGDGRADDLLVFHWTGASSGLRNTIVNAISDLVQSVQFSTVELEVDDPYGFVTGISPSSYSISGAPSGQIVQFTLDFLGAIPAGEEDEIYKLTLNVLGDGTVLLDTLDIYVVVPGRPQ